MQLWQNDHLCQVKWQDNGMIYELPEFELLPVEDKNTLAYKTS